MPFIEAAIFENFALMIEHDAFDFRLNLEASWYMGQTIDNRFKRLLADRCWLGLARVFRLKDRGGLLECRFLACLALLDRLYLFDPHRQPQRKFSFARALIVLA